MRIRTIVFAAAVMAAACSKVTQENFAKIEEGMGEQQVLALLGPPTESGNVSVLGISGTVSRWVEGDTVITVRFVNGKVALKIFDQASAKPK